MGQKWLAKLALLVCWCALIVAPGYAAPWPWQVQGAVELRVEREMVLMQPSCAATTQGEPAVGQPTISVGQAVVSDALGRAQLGLAGNAQVTLYHDSCTEIVTASQLRLVKGTLFLKAQESQTIVEVGTVRVEAKGSVLVHRPDPTGSTWVVVKDGRARMSAAGAQVTVTAGQQTWAEPGAAPITARPARRDVTGARFFLIDDLTNGHLMDAALLPPAGPPLWLPAVVVVAALALLAGGITIGRRRRPARPPARAVAGLRLALAKGYGRLVPLRRGMLTIGRARDNDLVLNSHQVSAHHARVVEGPKGYFIEDLESTNGTFVNDQRVTRQRVQNGDRVRIDQIKLVFQVVGAAPVAPLERAPQPAPAAPPKPAPQPAQPAPAAPPYRTPQPAPHAQASLRVVQPVGKGKPVVWAGDSLSIGRDKTNDLILKDPRVSTHHARVVRREDSYFIEDLGSRNGTFVNGQRVTQQHLQGDEQIQIGHTRLVFEIPRGQEVTP